MRGDQNEPLISGHDMTQGLPECPAHIPLRVRKCAGGSGGGGGRGVLIQYILSWALCTRCSFPCHIFFYKENILMSFKTTDLIDCVKIYW